MIYVIEQKTKDGDLISMYISTFQTLHPHWNVWERALKFYDKESAEWFMRYLDMMTHLYTFDVMEVTEHEEV